MRIAMHQLKAGLSRYMAQARAGEVIEVTSHDKPIARIIGIPSAEQPGVTRLLSQRRAVERRQTRTSTRRQARD